MNDIFFYDDMAAKIVKPAAMVVNQRAVLGWGNIRRLLSFLDINGWQCRRGVGLAERKEKRTSPSSSFGEITRVKNTIFDM